MSDRPSVLAPCFCLAIAAPVAAHGLGVFDLRATLQQALSP